jgi:DNA-binding response OmpR family regulator/tetratricopeptide (TPR) repeat protein
VAGTILCADDDRHFCQILARALAQAGWRVEMAHDGESALQKIRELDPVLVTLDVMLPRLDGFTVLEMLRKDPALRDTPVLLISGCTFSSDYEARARRLLAGAVLKKPVPLDQLLSLVSAHARKQGRGKAGAKPLELGGPLAELPFPALLHHLHGLRASGVLALEDGKKKKKQLQLRDGVPIAIRSNLVNETLGELLVASGKITPDVLHESLRRMKRGEGLMGNVLIAMHMLDEADLAVALHRQAEEKLFEIFGWESGVSQFHPGTRIKSSANTLALKRSPAGLILEGVRTRTPIAAIERYLVERADRLVVPGESPFYQFQDVELSSAERALFERLDGTTSLGTLARGGQAARRALYGLVVLELVELRSASTPAPQREQTAPPRAAAAPLAPTAKEPEGARNELTLLAERMRGVDAFGVLGVERAAGDEEVRAAYAELAKRTHPDRYATASAAVRRVAEEVFGMVSAAYEAIADQASRLQYLRDEAGRRQLEQEIDEGQRAVRAELEFQKGEVALRARRPDLAVTHFQTAVDSYPDEGEYHAWLGWALHLTAPGNPITLKKAFAHVHKGRKLAPDRAKPYLFLGRLYLAEGRSEVAEKMFSKTVQLDPDCLDALRELRLLNLRREKAKGLVRRLLRR